MSSPTDVIDSTDERWVTGDNFGIPIPADPEALLAGGAEFLTRAFRAASAMDADNSVVAIVDSEEFFDGGSGKKLKLTVVYAYFTPLSLYTSKRQIKLIYTSVSASF